MKQSLNFAWSFVDHFKDDYLKQLPKNIEVVDIPHSFNLVPYNYFDEKDYQKIATYEKIFDVEESLDNKVFVLHFAGFMLLAKIYLND